MKQDFLDAVSSLVGRLMEDSIHTSAPSKVGKVENNHTAKLTPNLKVTTDDGREVPYPEISGTIILMPCGAGGTVGFAFPVKSDDGCLALFNEGGSGTDLKWDLSNAALLPGLYQSPGEQVKKAGSEEAAIMFAPSSTITVTKDKIEIKKDDTKITVASDSIKVEKGGTTVTASSSSVDVTSPSLNIKGNTKVNGSHYAYATDINGTRQYVEFTRVNDVYLLLSVKVTSAGGLDDDFEARIKSLLMEEILSAGTSVRLQKFIRPIMENVSGVDYIEIRGLLSERPDIEGVEDSAMLTGVVPVSINQQPVVTMNGIRVVKA